jgi:methionyl-tRNA formyltransferase
LRERPSNVEKNALELGFSMALERTGPLSQNQALTREMIRNPPDVAFVVDFGQIVREPFLNGPRYGCLNIHPSLLPRWRGAAPVQRALLNGDATTGVTVFRLAAELDAGPILAQREIPIPLTADSTELFETLALAGSQIASRGVKSLIDNSCQFSDQNSKLATYAAKMTKGEAEIFWTQNYLRIHNTVRALASSTGAFTMVLGKRLKLWRTIPVDAQGDPGRILSFEEGDPVVACFNGAVRLLEVQSEGKRKISGGEWARGAKFDVGEGLMRSGR